MSDDLRRWKARLISDDDDGQGFDDILDRATACDECGAIGPVYLCGASVRCGRCAGIYEEQNHES